MPQPYSTTAQVLNQALLGIIKTAGWNLTEPGQQAVQDITYSALAVGQSPVTVNYIPGGSAGSEVVTVSGNNIVVKIQSGVSTATQVLAAINASAAALAIVSASITGTAGTAQVSTGAPIIITGDVVQRINEADRHIDTKLAGLEVALPFASNPPVIQDLSILYARYAIFRDLYSAGSPSALNPQADHYLTEFEKRWMDLEEGWQKLVDANGVQIAMTKFATVNIGYPCPAPNNGDLYPNFPSGPYPDPPGIGYPHD